jgi:inosine-uridine nucleoside N-ribohydrolase
MRKFNFILAACLMAWILVPQVSNAHTTGAKEKVILDTDMVEIFDDGIAMMMLQLAPEIDLVGVTTVVGNSWVNDGTAYAIRQLEAIKAADKVPVYMGVTRVLRPGRYETMAAERAIYGGGHDPWLGSAVYPEPESWQAVYRKQYGIEPKVAPEEQHAVDYIIETVKKYPGEITIAAIGTCANLAMAVRKAPEIVPLIKRVIYMGGSFFKQGNVTPTAEFNWWIDPETAKVAVRSPFKEQIVVGLDACEKITFKKHQYETVRQTVKNPIITDMLNKNVLMELYKNEGYTHYIWDVLVAAILIQPSLITDEETLPIDVNADFGNGYGQGVAFRGPAPEGTQQARIIKEVDEAKLWKLILDYCGKF